MVRNALQSKSGGQDILDEYDKTKTLKDNTRRRMINLLVANMTEVHGEDFIVQTGTCNNYLNAAEDTIKSYSKKKKLI